MFSKILRTSLGLFEKAKKKFLNEDVTRENIQISTSSPKRAIYEKPQEIGNSMISKQLVDK